MNPIYIYLAIFLFGLCVAAIGFIIASAYEKEHRG